MGKYAGGPRLWRAWHALGSRVLSSSLNRPRHQTSAYCGHVAALNPVARGNYSRSAFGMDLYFFRISTSRGVHGMGLGFNAHNEVLKQGTCRIRVKIDYDAIQPGMHLAGAKPTSQTWDRRLAISTAATINNDQSDDVEEAVTDVPKEEPGSSNVVPGSNVATAAKPTRRGVVGMSVAGTGVDPADMPYTSRASKLPLRPSLPSLRSQRPGEASVLNLHAVDAAASFAAGEAADWPRFTKFKEQESRPRSQHSSSSEAEPDDIFIPVKAHYISRSVDLKNLARGPFLEVTSSRNNLIIRCEDRPPHSPVTADNPEMACLGFLKERYMVVFQYGSVVFFNFGDLEEVESLDIVRKYCSDDLREARKDDYGVLVRPTLAEWSEGGHDRVMLRKLDIDNIRVISSILGQSIALDHYAKKVDEMVTTFSELNRGMEQTGTFTMTRKSLFQLVAAANTTLADVILRLGLLERSDAAWKAANYAQIWEFLRDDFELDERFESLDFKLNIIQHNVRFFLEILQNRKSDTLEWIIILLITGEICVSLYDILHSAGAL